MKCMVIDGNSIINRAYYGIRPLSNREGLFTHAIFGFLTTLLRLRDEEQPDALCVTFDVHAPTFRHKADEDYKATRKPMPEELRMQVPVLKEMLDEPGVPPDVFLMLAGIARDQRRDTELALSWLARIPASSPTAVQAEGLKAQILADAGKEKEALASVRNLQQRHARNETLLLLEVRLLARLKAMDEALARARQAVEIVPESSELAFTLGSLLDSLGKRDEAMKVMQGIIASHPEHYQALNYVGYSLAVQGKDLEHALELLQRADRLAPDQFFIVDSLAWALFRLGRTEEALQNIRRAVALVPSPEAEILEHYGDIAAADNGNGFVFEKCAVTRCTVRDAHAGEFLFTRYI